MLRGMGFPISNQGRARAEGARGGGCARVGAARPRCALTGSGTKLSILYDGGSIDNEISSAQAVVRPSHGRRRNENEVRSKVDLEMTVKWMISKDASRRDSKKESKCLTVKTIWKN